MRTIVLFTIVFVLVGSHAAGAKTTTDSQGRIAYIWATDSYYPYMEYYVAPSETTTTINTEFSCTVHAKDLDTINGSETDNCGNVIVTVAIVRSGSTVSWSYGGHGPTPGTHKYWFHVKRAHSTTGTFYDDYRVTDFAEEPFNDGYADFSQKVNIGPMGGGSDPPGGGG